MLICPATTELNVSTLINELDHCLSELT
jgi:hypothetical protein